MAIPPTSESVHAALIDGDQMLIVELREGDPELVALVRETEHSAVEGGMLAAGGGRKGKRAEYRCAGCGEELRWAGACIATPEPPYAPTSTRA